VTTEPSRATEPEGFLAWSQRAARIASDKLGRATMILDVGEVLAVTDLFVITSGSSARHVRTLVEAIEAEVVAVGGLGTIKGTFVAALVLGVIDNGGKYLWPEGGAFFIYAVTIVILLLKPAGLYGRQG